jgi:DNA polymerase (family 10)
MHDNSTIAELLEEIADLLENREADSYRVRAYRKAGQSVRDSEESLQSLFSRKGEQGLHEVPGIGEGLAAVVAEYLNTGRSSLRDDLAAQADPVHLFRQLPGISEKLARRIAQQLDVRSLEELELAAHDGRLKKLRGFGPERVQAVKEVLAGRLNRSVRREQGRAGKDPGNRDKADRPKVSLLLDIDREYRDRAQAGELKKISPRRFNPEGKAWLPLMRTQRQGWSFTVLFSNTSRAHELQKTRDWVVIYYRRNGSEGQCTIVTVHQGKLAGQRVVRGREPECRGYYGQS